MIQMEKKLFMTGFVLVLMFILVMFTVMQAVNVSAKVLACDPGEHLSNGHCCPKGEEWSNQDNQCGGHSCDSSYVWSKNLEKCVLSCPIGDHDSNGHCCKYDFTWKSSKCVYDKSGDSCTPTGAIKFCLNSKTQVEKLGKYDDDGNCVLQKDSYKITKKTPQNQTCENTSNTEGTITGSEFVCDADHVTDPILGKTCGTPCNNDGTCDKGEFADSCEDCSILKTCGNGILDNGEYCDPGNNRGSAVFMKGYSKCKNLGYASGTLSCSKECTLSTAKCSCDCSDKRDYCADHGKCKKYPLIIAPPVGPSTMAVAMALVRDGVFDNLDEQDQNTIKSKAKEAYNNELNGVNGQGATYVIGTFVCTAATLASGGALLSAETAVCGAITYGLASLHIVTLIAGMANAIGISTDCYNYQCSGWIMPPGNPDTAYYYFNPAAYLWSDPKPADSIKVPSNQSHVIKLVERHNGAYTDVACNVNGAFGSANVVNICLPQKLGLPKGVSCDYTLSDVSYGGATVGGKLYTLNNVSPVCILPYNSANPDGTLNLETASHCFNGNKVQTIGWYSRVGQECNASNPLQECNWWGVCTNHSCNYNNHIDKYEECDGVDMPPDITCLNFSNDQGRALLNNLTASNYGLVCKNCYVKPDHCIDVNSYCGNGKIDDFTSRGVPYAEPCDPGKDGKSPVYEAGSTCSNEAGKTGGESLLSCTDDCAIDYSNCIPSVKDETQCSDGSDSACCSNHKADSAYYHLDSNSNGKLFDTSTCLNSTACADCQDLDCNGVQTDDGTCEFKTETTCNDKFDNDGDGLTDCKDPDCGTKSQTTVGQRAKRTWNGQYYNDNISSSCCSQGVGCITPDGKCVDSGTVDNGFICVHDSSGSYSWESVYNTIGNDLYGITGNNPKKILCSKKDSSNSYYLNLEMMFPQLSQSDLKIIEDNTHGLCLLSTNSNVVVSFIENKSDLGDVSKSVIPLFSNEKAKSCNVVSGNKNDFEACVPSRKIWYDPYLKTVIISNITLSSVDSKSSSFSDILSAAAGHMFDAVGETQDSGYPLDYKYLFLSSDNQGKKIVSSVLSYNSTYYSYIWYDNVPCLFCDHVDGTSVIDTIMPPASCTSVGGPTILGAGVPVGSKSHIIVNGEVSSYNKLNISNGVWSGMSYLYPFNR